MQTDRKLEKARLTEIEWDEAGEASEVDGGISIEVQFNPTTLKVSYSNQVQSNDQSASSATQYVGRGTSKMSVELTFDVSLPFEGGEPPRDVREITERVFKFIAPREAPGGEADSPRFTVPGIRLRWGTFWFDGVVDSMDETLELWSEDGRPLRAVVSLSMSQQGIVFHRDNPAATGGAGQGAPSPGTRPLQPARAGDSIQAMAARAGRPGDWKQIAQANGVANPRQISAGQLIDVQLKTGARR